MTKSKYKTLILLLISFLAIVINAGYQYLENSQVKLLNDIDKSNFIKIDFPENDIIHSYTGSQLDVLKESLVLFVRFKHSNDMIKNSIVTKYCTFTIRIKEKEASTFDVYLIDIDKIDEKNLSYFHKLNGKYYVFKYRTYYYTFGKSINLTEL